jgi:hypothetical protein
MGIGDKAAEELAKLGQRSLESADKLGSWIDGIIGDGLRHVGGSFTDSMAVMRLKNRLKVLEKAQRLINDAGLSGSTRPLSDRLSLPIIEAIEHESDETVQDVWAAYLRDAVDPASPNPDRLLVDVIRRLEPVDWPILRRCFQQNTGELTPQDFEVRDDDLRASLDRLEVLGLFSFHPGTFKYITTDGTQTVGLLPVSWTSSYGVPRETGEPACKDEYSAASISLRR